MSLDNEKAMSPDKENETLEPKQSEELSAEDLKAVTGGAFDAYLIIDGVKG